MKERHGQCLWQLRKASGESSQRKLKRKLPSGSWRAGAEVRELGQSALGVERHGFRKQKAALAACQAELEQPRESAESSAASAQSQSESIAE